jgi:hypothetical protein
MFGTSWGVRDATSINFKSCDGHRAVSDYLNRKNLLKDRKPSQHVSLSRRALAQMWHTPEQHANNMVLSGLTCVAQSCGAEHCCKAAAGCGQRSQCSSGRQAQPQLLQRSGSGSACLRAAAAALWFVCVGHGLSYLHSEALSGRGYNLLTDESTIDWVGRRV